jgi:hypothetical protein
MDAAKQWVNNQMVSSDLKLNLKLMLTDLLQNPELYSYEGPICSDDLFTFSVPNTCAVCIVRGEGTVYVGEDTYMAQPDDELVVETFGNACSALDGATVIWIIKN